MRSSAPLVNDTATALRLAFGPGYLFGGPSDRQLEIIVRNTTVSNGGQRPQPRPQPRPQTRTRLR